MFSGRTFPYYGYHPMSSDPWNVGGGYLPRSDLADSEPEFYQPQVYNIPIHVETPEGLVPLSRSTSHYPGSSSSRFHSNNDHDESSVDEDDHEPDRIDETVTRQRPGPSPIPPPKPRFKPSHPSQGYHHQPSYHSQANQHHRVHNIPIRVEKGSNLQETVSQQKDSKSNVPGSGQKISVDSNPVKGSPAKPESPKPDEPVNSVKSDKNESKPQTKPVGDTPPKADPLNLIRGIQDEAAKLESEVNEFDGVNIKQYRYLDEMLTRCLLKLDNIDSEGREEVRSARKSTITHVDRVLATLESKFQKPNEPQAEQEATQVESDEHQSPEIGSSMETESVEADSTQQTESVDQPNPETNEIVESEQSNEVENQMEVEGNSNVLEERTITQTEEERVDVEPIENSENPSVDDGSVENCPDNQLNNEADPVGVEEMGKELHDGRPEVPEPPVKMNRVDTDEKVDSDHPTETDH